MLKIRGATGCALWMRILCLREGRRCRVRSPTVREGPVGWRALPHGRASDTCVGMMGQLVTETNRWYFPDANTIDKRFIVTLSNGQLDELRVQRKARVAVTIINGADKS